MEFIQKKTADPAVERFVLKAADQEVSLPWDRYEGQLPECGFCEAGLSCRDCLQGPCISHPFKESNKVGVCGKDKDALAVQSLLRLVLKGTMAYLDPLNDFVREVGSGAAAPKDKKKADQVVKQVRGLLEKGAQGMTADFPKQILDAWATRGVMPEGLSRDLIKASQKLEGGVGSVEETLLWAIKCALLGTLAYRLHGKLKAAVFGSPGATQVRLNLGVLKKDAPNIVLYGRMSPVLKQQIALKAEEKNIFVGGVCTDPLVPPHIFSPVTNYGSQEIPLMTGAVDLVVAGDQCVNPSLKDFAKEYTVKLVCPNSLTQTADPAALADEIIRLAMESYDLRKDIPRQIPDAVQTAVMAFDAAGPGAKKILDALSAGKIKGIALFAGSNNVKFTQDREFITIVERFLKEDILCISEGEASVGLAKYGFLNPKETKECGAGLKGLLSSLGDAVPAVIDCNATDFLLALAKTGKTPIKGLPIAAYFAEAGRSTEVAKALSWVAMGVNTYFWPCLPVTGSPRTMEALSDFCGEAFGAKLNIVTKRIEAPAKAELFLHAISAPAPMSGKAWK